MCTCKMTTHTWRSVVGARGSHYYDGKDPQNKLVGQFPVGLNYLFYESFPSLLGAAVGVCQRNHSSATASSKNKLGFRRDLFKTCTACRTLGRCVTLRLATNECTCACMC